MSAEDLTNVNEEGAASPEAPAAPEPAQSSGLSAIEAKMAEATYKMQAMYLEAKAARLAFEEQKGQYDQIMHRIESTRATENRLRLNIGGTRYEIRETVAIKNPFFKTLLSGELGAHKDKDGFFFVDRDPFYVRFIFKYLREGESVNLRGLTNFQLKRLHTEADFYMVDGLVELVEKRLNAMGSGKTGPVVCSLNGNLRSWPISFNGIFFELTLEKEARLAGVSFIAGDRRRIPCLLLLREGGIDGSGQTQRVAEVHQHAEKGESVAMSFSAVTLSAGTHTIGFYCNGAATLAVVPKADSSRPTVPNVTWGRTYHTTNQRGDWGKRAGEDEYDFCGELMLAF